jgi:hypothetical protein
MCSVVDSCKRVGDIKCLRFQGVSFISGRFGQNISTKMGHHIYECKCKFGFETFVAVESHLASAVFRHFMVLYRGVNTLTEKTLLLQSSSNEGGVFY